VSVYTPNRRRLVDTKDLAKEMRRTFHDTDPKRSERMPFTWPDELQVVGKCLSVTYSSDKWKRSREYEDYKHVSEAPQFILMAPGFLTDWETDEPIDMVGPIAELPDPMPRHFAKLAKFLGIQLQLYGSMSADGRPRLSRSAEDLLEFRLGRAHLGGAYVPEDAETPRGIGLDPGAPFLFVYTLEDELVPCIVTGKQLDVEKDGITG
jgi:hypothetical protein